MVADSITNGDKKMSYYREHTHALASGVDAGRIMAELFAKDGGTCRGAGGSMHIYDKDTHFQVHVRGLWLQEAKGGGRGGGSVSLVDCGRSGSSRLFEVNRQCFQWPGADRGWACKLISTLSCLEIISDGHHNCISSVIWHNAELLVRRLQPSAGHETGEICSANASRGIG